MQTHLLKTLLKISQVQSFALAAEHLNMTLSAVSMQMKSLEQQLDASLFDRKFRPPKLTPLGLAVAEKAQVVIDAEQAMIDLCERGDQLTGRYRLGFVSTASARLLPTFLTNALRRAPDAKFDFETGLSEQLEEKVLNGQLDAAVVTVSGQTDDRLQTDILLQERLIFAAPRNLGPLGLKAMMLVAPFLHFMPSTGIGKLIAQEMTRSGDGILHSKLVLDSVEAIMECVKNGVGFTLLPEPDVLRLADSNVITIELEEPGLYRELALVTLPNSPTASSSGLLKNLLII
ncbi:MAG: LysR family transcriptional regulator [Rhizobiaceae bacterium]|nr:LysR family transcriptional regulator [Rhizobiaceae bacterium]